MRVQTLAPVSNDAVAFTPTGQASNWQNAATVPPVPAADFNASATVGAQDTFHMGALAADLGTVFGLSVKTLMFKSDAGSRSGEAIIKSGGTVAAGAAIPLGLTPARVSAMFTTDPATGAAWTAAGVNAATAGYKVSA